MVLLESATQGEILFLLFSLTYTTIVFPQHTKILFLVHGIAKIFLHFITLFLFLPLYKPVLPEKRNIILNKRANHMPMFMFINPVQPK